MTDGAGAAGNISCPIRQLVVEMPSSVRWISVFWFYIIPYESNPGSCDQVYYQAQCQWQDEWSCFVIWILIAAPAD